MTNVMNVVLILSLWLSTTASAHESSVPESITVTGSREPFWVAARALADLPGKTGYALLDSRMEEHRMIMRDQLNKGDEGALAQKSEAEQCPVRTITPFHTARDVPHDSWAAMTEHALAIYAGRITAVEAGFFGGLPASLLRVQISEVVRSHAAFPSSGHLFVPYPAADFDVRGARFCNTGSNTDYMPQISDEILIFAYEEPLDSSGRSLRTTEGNLVFLSKGKLVVSRELTDRDGLLSFRSLTEALGQTKSLEPQRTEDGLK